MTCLALGIVAAAEALGIPPGLVVAELETAHGPNAPATRTSAERKAARFARRRRWPD
jgi:hypothetical protein